MFSPWFVVLQSGESLSTDLESSSSDDGEGSVSLSHSLTGGVTAGWVERGGQAAPTAVTDEDWIPPEGFVPLAVNEVSRGGHFLSAVNGHALI
jgi:hypothetical protein